MSRTPSQKSYAWVYVIGCAVIYALSYLPVPHGSIGDPPELEEAAKATLDLIMSMNTLMGTLNTAMFGAACALAIRGRDWSSRWSYFDGLLVVFALMSGAVSYYGIYLCHVQLVGMAAAGFVSATAPGLDVALKVQYYATLLGFFLVGLLFTRMLQYRSTTKPK